MTLPARVRMLIDRLEAIEAQQPPPQDRAILEVARRALLEELQRAVRADGLMLYRRAGSFGAISDAP